MTHARVVVSYARIDPAIDPTIDPAIDPVIEPEGDKAARDALAALPAPVRQRLDAMRSTTARAHSLAGYRLLQAGGRSAGVAIDLAALGQDANGRPRLAHGPDFNISHSHGLVACALGVGCRVGLDVERLRSRVHPRLARRLAWRGDHAGDFFHAWAAREASVKAGGRVGLARIVRVRLGPDTARVDDEVWRLTRLDMLADYAGCLACDVPEIELSIQDCTHLFTRG